jgi:hypothetical protein
MNDLTSTGITLTPQKRTCSGTNATEKRKFRALKVFIVVLLCLVGVCIFKEGLNSYLAKRDREIKYLHEISGYLKEADIAAVVKTGIPVSVVFQTFGNPAFTDFPTNGTTRHFWAYDPLLGKKKGIYKDVFSGFTVIEKAGVVVNWDPIYSSGNF